ncbi:MAG: hypothetical protein Terrestrivirus1_200 [Terrestrivirus sp.]|uniref:Uncharacterized protein n=1 Tax=Terrestrivirus sp. TaxID=2487775 RepID=A0A3G4ZKG3_9VIRU|nr:MAG: hypothetical protein Terrestrivirus1_200 [Terrestrivirus sp.]
MASQLVERLTYKIEVCKNFLDSETDFGAYYRGMTGCKRCDKGICEFDSDCMFFEKSWAEDRLYRVTEDYTAVSSFRSVLEVSSKHFSDDEIVRISTFLSSKFVQTFVKDKHEMAKVPTSAELVRSLGFQIGDYIWSCADERNALGYYTTCQCVKDDYDNFTCDMCSIKEIITLFNQKIKDLTSLESFIKDHENFDGPILSHLMVMIPSMSSRAVQEFFTDFVKWQQAEARNALVSTIIDDDDDILVHALDVECESLCEIGGFVVRDFFNDISVSRPKSRKNRSSSKNIEKLMKQKDLKEKKRRLPSKTRDSKIDF